MPEKSVDLLTDSFVNLWNGFLDFLAKFIPALIIFIAGWFIAVIIGQVIAKVIRALPIDSVLEQLGLKNVLEKAGVKLDTGKFIGGLVKWYIIIAVFLATTDILELTAVTAFLQTVLNYIPNIIVSALILVATVLVANFLQKSTKASMEAADLHHSNFVAAVVKWAIWIFGILATLSQLGIAQALVGSIIYGIIAMLAIAAGLAFGLGGKEFAADILDKLRKEASHKS